MRIPASSRLPGGRVRGGAARTRPATRPRRVKFRVLGSSGLRVSVAALGTATFGEDGWGSDRDESRLIFERYFDAGGRFVDVSNTYARGLSETIVGELARGRRDELVIGTKFTASTRPGDPNAWGNHRKSLRQSLDTSLKRLGTDFVDIMWIHCWDGITPLDEIMRALDDEVRAGKILYIGASNTPAWAISRATTVAEFRGWTSFVALQAEYNLASRTPEHELIPMAQSLGLEVLAWSPLAGGLLTGGYARGDVTGTRFEQDSIPRRRLEVAAEVARIADEAAIPPLRLALGWLLQRPFAVTPILGARRLTQLDGLLDALDEHLPPEVLVALDRATAPPPIMPREGLDMPGVDLYFHAGAGDAMVSP
jgi:aryl-alcohol dehydrogenase-like predicted oxidoreductase